MAALAFAGVWLFAPWPSNTGILGLGLLAVLGAVATACLAVAMGSNAADLSDDRRPVVGLSTVWLFMITAALFNTAISGEGQIRVRALLLYGMGVALHWMTGMENLARAYDPEHRGARRILPGDGATLAILLYLGQRVVSMAASPASSLGPAVWSGILLIFAASLLHRASCSRPPRGLLASVVVALVAGAAGAQIFPPSLSPSSWDLSAVALVVGCIAEEVIVRGLLQRALSERWPGLRGQVTALLISTAVAWLVGRSSLSFVSVVTAATGAAVWAATRRTWGAVLARFLLVLLP